MRADEVLADLRAEHDELVALVRTADLDQVIPAEPWDVRDCVSHLVVGDRNTHLALTDPDAFLATLPGVVGDPQAFLDSWLEVGKGLDRDALLDMWKRQFDALMEAFAAVPEGVKVPWYGPPMSLTSAATARLMEYWAHGQDVVDAVGAERAPTDRLRHIARLGVRTRDFAYRLRGLIPPPEPVRVTLDAPDGSSWEWGEGDDAVEGPALDFCLRVTQRRHLDDLALRTTGPLATEWMGIAQCFAGLPTDGRGRLTADRS